MKNNVLKKIIIFIPLICLPLLALIVLNSQSSDNNVQLDDNNTYSWPGASEVQSSELLFREDSSGLDFHDNQLYAVDNDASLVWILDVMTDGTLQPAPGYEHGKSILFPDGVTQPDSEGITVDSEKNIYIASEAGLVRTENSHNYIMRVTFDADESTAVADQVWDLNQSLPTVQYNKGIEAIEWIPNADASEHLYDKNTLKPFNPENYPNAIGDGVFFVSLEATGHIYAYILNGDGSSVQIADFNPHLGGAMALDYDVNSHLLWVITDNNFHNKSAVLQFNGEESPAIAYVNPPAGVDINHNHEGFAIGVQEYDKNKNDALPVYRFCDSPDKRSLSVGFLDSQYNDKIF